MSQNLAETTEVIEADYLGRCRLLAIAQEAPSIDLDTILELQESTGESDNDDAPLPQVPQREALFLDEKLTASVILQCPWIEKHTFEEFVKRLSISLEVYAIGVKASSGEKESKAANVKDLLDSSVIEDGSDIQIAVRDGSSDESEDEDSSDLEHKRISRTTTWLLWKTDLHILRNRVHTPSPDVYLSATATLRPMPQPPSDPSSSLLPSLTPDSPNLFSAFAADPALHNRQKPVLTAARLTKHVPPTSPTTAPARPLRNLQRRMMKLAPALGTRLRCVKVGTAPSQVRVLASIEVDVAASIGSGTQVRLESVSVTISEGHTVSLDRGVLSLPRVCRARDRLTFAYDLRPNVDAPQAQKTHILYFKLHASLLPLPESDDRACGAIPLLTQWRTSLDLTSLHNKHQPLPLTTSPSRPSPREREAQPTKSFADYLLTMTISGPHRTRMHAHLTWTLLAVNRDEARTLPLCVLPLMCPPYRHAEQDAESLPSDSSDDEPSTATTRSPKKTKGPRPPDLVPLTPEVKFRALGPGESAEAVVRFLVVRAGVLERPGLRVVDLDRIAGDDEEREVRRLRTFGGEGKEKEGVNETGKGEGWIDVPRGCMPDIISLGAEE